MKQLIFIFLAFIGVSQAQTIQYIGAPTTTVISRGNFRTDSIFYLPKRTKLPTDTAALRYQISDSSLYAWSGSQWRKVGADADTLVYSTRAWRQKGDDSLAARINLKVNISDTASMLTPYLRKGDTTAMLSPYYRSATASAALALKLNISDTSTMLGNYVRHAGYGLTKSGQSFLVDTLNIATRAWRQKGLDSLAALEVSGSGTTNYMAKFTAGSTIGNSQIFDNGTNVGIGTSSPALKLHVVGDIGTTTRVATDLINGWTGGSTPLTIQTGGAQNLIFGTNATERLRIFANGRVFIGASPTDAGYQLDVAGSLRNTTGANFATTSGNVGIGTTSPATYAGYTTLAVNNATNGGVIDVMRNNSVILQIFGDAGASGIGSLANVPFTFKTNSIEQGRINTAGEFLLNSTNSDAGDYKLQVSGNIYNTGSAVLAATSGGVAIGTTTTSGKLNILGDNDQININTTGTWSAIYFKNAGADRAAFYVNNTAAYIEGRGSSGLYLGGAGATAHVNLNSNGELIIGTGAADAGDYKLQVVGNARIGTGKLDIASNTTFGIGVARSGTSEVAGQIFNSNGILYLGAESSAGGQIFTGSSAYAAVIGSGANYPLQFATNNATRATINTNGELLINTLTDNGDFKLQVNGNALISGSIKTANGTSSTAVPWHLGSVVATSVQLDTANYVEVEINGTFYRLAIVTPL